MRYVSTRRDAPPVQSPGRESSPQASSAARARRAGLSWLALETTRGLDEDVAYRQRRREIRQGLPFLDADVAVPAGRGPAELRDPSLRPLDDWLRQRADQVAATPEELAVAERRAQAVTDALASIYPGAEVYQTGSIAHGDALSPLNDVDLGVILAGRPDLGTGPGQHGPRQEMRQTAARLTELLRPRYPKLTANPDHKRSIVLEFNEPAGSGADFTCDVIIAVPGAGGNLLIPNTELSAGWDDNDPQGHVERLRQAEQASGGSFSRTVRLVKDWRNHQSDKPFYSWNIKTLALEAGQDATLPFEGLYRFFSHAIHSAAEGPTENPGSVSFPPPTVPIDRLEVIRLLADARRTLDRARMYALDDQPERAVAELMTLFP